jgi:hypothetical protein
MTDPAAFAAKDAPTRNPVVAVLIYGAVGIALVVGIGRGLADLVGMGTTFLTSRPSLLVEVALFWVGGWGLARDIDFEENLRKERARAKELEREKDHAELVALKSHLDPHFLFNTLNAIAEWCRTDGKVAEKAILQLSGMLRTVMSGIDAPGGAWPLEKEIELCDALFAMYLVRDPEMFVYEKVLPAKLPNASVLPMVLLPIAENAMKHGPSKGHRGKVTLEVETTAYAFSCATTSSWPASASRASSPSCPESKPCSSARAAKKSSLGLPKKTSTWRFSTSTCLASRGSKRPQKCRKNGRT